MNIGFAGEVNSVLNDGNLSTHEALTLIALFRRKEEGERMYKPYCIISEEKLSKLVKCPISKLREVLTSLENLGYLEVIHRKSNRRPNMLDKYSWEFEEVDKEKLKNIITVFDGGKNKED